MMKQALRFSFLTAILSLAVTAVRADSAALAQVVKERDQVLSQILAEREARFSTGIVDGEGVFSARIALWTFRRDVAATRQEKLKQQELIIGAYEKRLEAVKARVQTGTGLKEELLLATDRLLEAKQVLETLRVEK